MTQTRLWLATIAALLGFLTVDAYDFSVNGVYYNRTSSSTVEVTYKGSSYSDYYNKYSGAITIPPGVTYGGCTYMVTGIGEYAFYECGSVTSIIISENVESIGMYAFYGCRALTSITIPEKVKSLGWWTFGYCTRLNSIIIPEGMTTIGYRAFSNCSSLTSTIIPSSVTNIANCAFYGCTGELVVNCNVPSSEEKSNGAFAESSFSKVTIGTGVTSIGDNAFWNCSNLTSIIIPESVTSIGNSAFAECSSLASVYINNIKAWCEINFSNQYANPLCYASNLYLNEELVSELYIPTTVSTVKKYAFYNCNSLTSVTIPESVTNFGSYAFEGCSSFSAVHINSIEGWCNISFGNYSANPLYYAKNLYLNRELVAELIIPEGVTSIGDYAFSGCTQLSSITIPGSVLSIGSNAFTTTPKKTIWLTNTPPTGYANAKGSINYVANNQYTSLSNTKVYPYLSSMFEVDGVKYVPVSPSERTCHAIDCAHDSTAEIINVGETTSFKGVAMKVTEVMPYTFYGNNHIKEVTMSHLGNIEDYAFYNCDSIKTVNVFNQGNIGSQAFYDCDGIESVIVSNQGGIGNQAFYNCDGIKDVNISNLGNIGSQAFYNCDAIESVTISNQGNIGELAFYDCNGIKTIEVNNRGSVGTQAFYSCTGMETAIIDNVGNVNSEVFSGCSSLQTITLGDSIGSLGSKAFYQCTSLQGIVVPDFVKVVGEYCFSGCSAMKSATIGDGVSNIAAYTFQGCTALEDVVVGDGVTTISNYAFTGCSALTNIELGNSVATINNYAFQNCSSLPEISIPQSTTTIGDYTFSGCSQLADVIIEDRTTALNLGSNGSSALFADCPLDSVYIGGKITYSTTSSKGYSPFYRNTSLRSVVITDREDQIYANEFYGCTNLQNVAIGNGVKSIGNYAFSGCSSLAGFSFGSNMESIGAEAFSDCTSLTSITSHAAVPPTCGTQALDDINKWECVLGVPLGNADAYYAADQWKEFFFIEDVVEVDHYVLTYVVDGEVVHTEVLKHKDEVTMLAEPTKVGYEFSGWDRTLTTMPAEDVIISGTFTRLPVDNLVILDTEENFLIDEEMECETVTYIRHFDETQWQALYLPFAIPYDSLYKEFEVAYINDMHQFDDDNNGTIDRTEVEAIKIVEGMLKANYPYLIKAKSIGEKSIVVADATLYATEENSVDCSSVFTNYTFTGSYSTLSGEELAHNEGYYVLSDGMWQPLAEGASLGAFRIYLKIESRDGNNAILSQAAIRMRVVGDEENEDDATGIENSTGNGQQATVYDLQGRKVLNTDNLKGIYIVDGKKVVIK